MLATGAASGPGAGVGDGDRRRGAGRRPRVCPSRRQFYRFIFSVPARGLTREASPTARRDRNGTAFHFVSAGVINGEGARRRPPPAGVRHKREVN